jgi:hypothetical protein
MVRQDSPLKDVGDVDSPGIKIGVGLAHAGGGVELLVDEHRNAGGRAADLGAHQLGVLERARQIKIQAV